jgi:hypothetical protein
MEDIRMYSKGFLSLSIIPIVFSFSLQVQAAPPVLDQVALPNNAEPFTYALNSDQVLYQSLTVGLSGRLAELRLPIGCGSGEVIVEIFNADPTTGLPVAGGLPRLTRSFRADMFPEVVSIDFQPLPLGGRVGVTAGDEIVIVLSNPTGSCGIAAGVEGDIYTLGTGHADDLTNIFPPVPLNISPGGGDDLPFQTLVRRTGPPSP